MEAMKLDEQKILQRAEEIYIDAKYEVHLAQTESLPRWRRPKHEFARQNLLGIRSDQVKSVVKAIVEAINAAE